MKIVITITRFLAAVIMIQTLYFKFTGHPNSIHIFTVIGMEPWGRIFIGIMELVASTLLIIPVTAYLGALLTVGLMSGAIFFHVSNPDLGVVVNNDGGLLFILAITCLVCGLVMVFCFKDKYLNLISKVLKGTESK